MPWGASQSITPSKRQLALVCSHSHVLLRTVPPNHCCLARVAGTQDPLALQEPQGALVQSLPYHRDSVVWLGAVQLNQSWLRVALMVQRLNL